MIWVLIFGVFYPLMTLAVICVGVFGMAANKPERLKEAKRTNLYPYLDPNGRGRYQWLTFQATLTVLGCAVVWPVAIPMYLSWKKGTFIADALAKRDALQDAA